MTNYEHTSDRAFSECPKMLLFNRHILGYVVHVFIPLHSVQGKSGSDLLDLALQELELAGFPDALKELVRLSPK